MLQVCSAVGDSDVLTDCETDVNEDFTESTSPFLAVFKGFSSPLQSLAFLICKVVAILLTDSLKMTVVCLLRVKYLHLHVIYHRCCARF